VEKAQRASASRISNKDIITELVDLRQRLIQLQQQQSLLKPYLAGLLTDILQQGLTQQRGDLKDAVFDLRQAAYRSSSQYGRAKHAVAQENADREADRHAFSKDAALRHHRSVPEVPHQRGVVHSRPDPAILNRGWEQQQQLSLWEQQQSPQQEEQPPFYWGPPPPNCRSNGPYNDWEPPPPPTGPGNKGPVLQRLSY
jgi:hypothetical protein